MKEFIPEYFITKEGKIYSKLGEKGLRELRPHIGSRGYMIITIRKKCYRIHRLVAENFLPKVDGKPIVNHIDGNKLNNNVNNLEWCTQSENVKHAWNKGLNSRTREGSHRKVCCILGGKIIAEYDSIKEAEEKNPKAKGHIAACCRGKRKTAGGYIWKYIE